MFFFALLLLMSLNIFAAISEDAVFLQATKPLFIPVFLVFYFIKNKIINLLFVLFLVSSFVGDAAFVFVSSYTVEKSSNLMYFMSYICLIGIIVSKFNLVKIDKVVGIYLVFMFLINAYFLYLLYKILKIMIADNAEVLIFGLKSASLIILLLVSFGAYLAKDSALSILFLMLGLCFFFSDILNYITSYYLYDWRFVMIDRLLHATGLFFLFNYIAEANKIVKEPAVNQGRVPSENLLA